jgi:hypothetical protein
MPSSAPPRKREQAKSSLGVGYFFRISQTLSPVFFLASSLYGFIFGFSTVSIPQSPSSIMDFVMSFLSCVCSSFSFHFIFVFISFLASPNHIFCENIFSFIRSVFFRFTSVPSCGMQCLVRATQCCVQEDRTLHNHGCENFK